MVCWKDKKPVVALSALPDVVDQMTTCRRNLNQNDHKDAQRERKRRVLWEDGIDELQEDADIRKFGPPAAKSRKTDHVREVPMPAILDIYNRFKGIPIYSVSTL